jgi:hypothetical protein
MLLYLYTIHYNGHYNQYNLNLKKKKKKKKKARKIFLISSFNIIRCVLYSEVREPCL